MAPKGEGNGPAKQGSVAAGAKKAAPGGKRPPPGKAKRSRSRTASPARRAAPSPRAAPAASSARPGPPASRTSPGRPASRQRRARPGRRRRSDHERGRSGGRVTPPGPSTPFPPDQGAGSMEEPDDLQPIEEEEEEEEETEFATIAGGATVEEAKRKALEQLRKIVPYVNPEDVEYIVVEEGSKGGLFGRGKSRLESRPGAPVGRARRSRPARGRRGASGVRPDRRRPHGIEARWAPAKARVGARRHERRRSRAAYRPARRHHRRPAVRAAIVVNGDRRERRQVIVDAEGYRDRRAAALTALADRTAQKVARESVSVALEAHDGGGAQGDRSPPQGPPAGSRRSPRATNRSAPSSSLPRQPVARVSRASHGKRGPLPGREDERARSARRDDRRIQCES